MEAQAEVFLYAEYIGHMGDHCEETIFAGQIGWSVVVASYVLERAWELPQCRQGHSDLGVGGTDHLCFCMGKGGAWFGLGDQFGDCGTA